MTVYFRHLNGETGMMPYKDYLKRVGDRGADYESRLLLHAKVTIRAEELNKASY